MAHWDGFSDWEDVALQFTETSWSDSNEVRLAKALAEIPEPEEVLVAVYNSEGYEGSALVAYRNGNKYYVATGGHCSCYGLEGQFDPEEYESAELLLACLQKGNWDYKEGYKELMQIIKEKVKTND